MDNDKPATPFWTLQSHTELNGGPLTINGVTLHKNGKPFKAGQIREGKQYTINVLTGEVISIEE